MTTRMIIDADPGIGDALAIGLALFDPEIEVLALTAAGGCVSGKFSTQNVEAIISMLDPPRSPRCGVSDDPMALIPEHLLAGHPAPVVLNGETGLGDWLRPTFERHRRHESEKLLVELIRQYPNDITVLTLGPLTNVMRAIEHDPELPQMIGSLVCMGGAVQCGGDVTAAAEFNMFADPAAAEIVLDCPATKTLVPLDVTNNVVLDFDQYDRLPLQKSEKPLCKMFADLLAFAMRNSHQRLGQEGMTLAAVTALASIMRPNSFDTTPMIVDVETAGDLTRGMTVFDRRHVEQWQTNIEVVTEADSRAVIDYIHAILKRA